MTHNDFSFKNDILDPIQFFFKNNGINIINSPIYIINFPKHCFEVPEEIFKKKNVNNDNNNYFNIENKENITDFS